MASKSFFKRHLLYLMSPVFLVTLACKQRQVDTSFVSSFTTLEVDYTETGESIFYENFENSDPPLENFIEENSIAIQHLFLNHSSFDSITLEGLDYKSAKRVFGEIIQEEKLNLLMKKLFDAYQGNPIQKEKITKHQLLEIASNQFYMNGENRILCVRNDGYFSTTHPLIEACCIQFVFNDFYKEEEKTYFEAFFSDTLFSQNTNFRNWLMENHEFKNMIFTAYTENKNKLPFEVVK